MIPQKKVGEFDSNELYLIENGRERRVSKFDIPGLSFEIKGKNNSVRIEMPTKFFGSTLHIDSNGANIYIESCNTWGLINCYIRIAYGERQQLKIGKDTTCCNLTLNLDGTSCCYIGRDCMFGGNVILLPSDGHSVIDAETGELLNSDGTICIGDHVWVGASSIICKNTNLPKGSIIAAGSVVSKVKAKENSIIAGTPAKVIRTGRTWDRANPYFYKS